MSAVSLKDRCPHCGAVPRGIWTRAAILTAIAEWVEEHGQAPTQRQWFRNTAGTPGQTRIRVVFGSWNGMMTAAGLTPRPRGGRARMWTREQAEQALLAWVFDHGRVPRQVDWQKSVPGRPSRQQVESLYGGWNAFIVAAGYRPHRMSRSSEGYARQAGAALRQRTTEGTFA